MTLQMFQRRKDSLQRTDVIIMIDETLLRRITANPEIFGGKPIRLTKSDVEQRTGRKAGGGTD